MPSTVGSILYWVHPEPGKCRYELQSGDRVLATLEWKSIPDRDAEGTSGDRLLSLKRLGFFFHYVTITDVAAGSEMGIFKFYGGDKGELTFRDGYKIRWKFEGILEPRWYFTTEKGSDLIRFSVPKSKDGVGSRTIAIVEILREIDEKSISLLAVIGWYNIFNILSSGL
jgi:hypothetical protein